MAHSAILKPGATYWRIEHADRAAFLVDGAEFFRSFRETVKTGTAFGIDHCLKYRAPIERYLT